MQSGCLRALVQQMALLQNSSPALEPVNQERSRRISTLVDSTFDLSIKELRSFLDRECPDDPDLRAEVERRVIERGTATALPTPSLRRMTPTLAAGEVIAERYRITRLIGRGGMGEVYEAHDLLLEEDVAVKTLRADLAGEETPPAAISEGDLARAKGHPSECLPDLRGGHPSTGRRNRRSCSSRWSCSAARRWPTASAPGG